ncbi:MAG: phosphoserine phosphatase SerB [Hyphomicrobiales bacterium]|nr:phosphoserine phosphatase SerB [Hyphomicrobiales bacterium]
MLTLISGPDGGRALHAVSPELASLFKTQADWLADGIACDLLIHMEGGPHALKAARALIGDAPIDAVIQPAAGRRKRLLVADMDSTVIEQECIDEMAAVAGVGAQVAAITEAAMRGELDFEAALIERINMIRGFPVAGLQDILDNCITLTPGAAELTATMRAHGARCILVSGGFTFFTDTIAKRAGFDASHGNTLVISDGTVAGVKQPILGREYKLEALRAEADKMGVDIADTMAVGDGANDLAMLGSAGLGVAFKAKDVVARAAAARIDHGDLTALLYIQGYKRIDFRKS